MKEMQLGINSMRWALNFGFWGPGIAPTVEMVQYAESLGYDSVWTSEASGTDSVTPLAYLAGKTTRIKVGSNAMQMVGRSPATTAMTAVTMDMLTNGRFMLGVGASGPAVVEGWHNQPYGQPLVRTREYLTIVREIVARQRPLEFHGEYYDIPYRREGSTGLANPIKLMIRPRRPRIPTFLAAMGPKNMRLAMEMCDGIMPVAWSPTREHLFFGELNKPEVRAEVDAVREQQGFGPFQICPFVPVAIGDDVDSCYDQLRGTTAFWLGAMGPPDRNFYNKLACRFGYEESATKVAELYAAGRPREAAGHVTNELIDEMSLCGPVERIRDQLEAWRESSVTRMILCGLNKDAMRIMAELVLA